MNTDKQIPLYVLGALIVLGFFGLLGLMVFFEIPEKNEKLLYMVVGALVSGFVAVFQYFYGSSKSSQDKTKILVEKKDKENPES